MTTLYRLLSAPDDAAFCHKISAALAAGWRLHGSPAYAWDPAASVMRCAQAVTKEVEAPYAAQMKLGEQ